MNEPVLRPAAIATTEGTRADVASLVFNVIIAPVIGAGSPNVSVAFTVVPPATVAVSSASETGGRTVTVVVTVLRPNTALMVALTAAVTAVVVAVNVADD